MNLTSGLFETSIEGLNLRARGKVRDIYDVDDRTMLIVTTDRISAFDVILADPIPGKGRVLTAVSNFWFEKMQDVVPNHLSDRPLNQIITDPTQREIVESRSIVVKKLKPLPLEAIVRGYLIGSGWKDYQNTQSVCGIKLSEGLRQAERLPNAIYTPSTKAQVGGHDENISFGKTVDLIGRDLAEQVREISLQLYIEAAEYAKARGMIIADTKFEYGLDNDGKLYLIDEVLTPDSSRFWPVDQYQLGVSPPSFDKQFVRDYLESIGWDKNPPGPHLPEKVIHITAEKYREAELKLTSVKG